MNKELIIIIGVSALALTFLILFIRSKIKCKKLYEQLISKNKEFTHVKNRLCMIEHHHRNYKEGMNPFTVLRDISNTLYEEEDEKDESIQKTQ